jgi:hypothetical protein
MKRQRLGAPACSPREANSRSPAAGGRWLRARPRGRHRPWAPRVTKRRRRDRRSRNVGRALAKATGAVGSAAVSAGRWPEGAAPQAAAAERHRTDGRGAADRDVGCPLHALVFGIRRALGDEPRFSQAAVRDRRVRLTKRPPAGLPSSGRSSRPATCSYGRRSAKSRPKPP